MLSYSAAVLVLAATAAFVFAQSSPGLPKPDDDTAPSLDCARARLPAETMVCADRDLAALDLALANAWASALKGGWSAADTTRQRTRQGAWMNERNACAQAQDARACLEDSYRRRTVEVQITSGQLPIPTPVAFRCRGRETEPFTAAFYNQTQPPSAVFTIGGRQVLAFRVLTASGARYQAPDLDFWEHQGEATVKSAGATFTCAPVQ